MLTFATPFSGRIVLAGDSVRAILLFIGSDDKGLRIGTHGCESMLNVRSSVL